jgi:NAD(P)H-dependent FMN reductase
MKNLLIISSTKNTNLDLSYEIKKYLDNFSDGEISVLSLEEYDLPLYTPTLEEKFKQNNSFPDTIERVKKILINSRAIIWCSPEYNGGISPIVTNTIAWISRATEDWREAFKDKKILICSSSGGNGKNFIKGFRIQLDYLGSNVSEDYIIRTKKNGGDKDNFEQILTKFYEQLNN